MCSNTLAWLLYENQRFGHGQPNIWNIGNLVMDGFDLNYIYRNLKPQPLIYVRYIDDTGTIVNDANEAGQALRYLNKQHPTNDFDLELPDESGFLPIYDIKIMINKDGSRQEPINLHHNLRFECCTYQKSLTEGFDTY